jgi:hypothetical protein
MTPLSSALLSTLEDMPPLKEAPQNNDEDHSEFPARMAQALFKTGDYVGSLKHFLMVKDEDMTPRDRYELARCWEETGQAAKALPVVAKLIQVTLANDPFWNQRAKHLEQLLKPNLGLATKKTKGKES